MDATARLATTGMSLGLNAFVTGLLGRSGVPYRPASVVLRLVAQQATQILMVVSVKEGSSGMQYQIHVTVIRLVDQEPYLLTDHVLTVILILAQMGLYLQQVNVVAK